MSDLSLTSRTRSAAQESLRGIGRRADLLMLAMVGLGGLVALWIGWQHGRPGTAALWSALLLGVACWPGAWPEARWPRRC